MLHRNLGFGGAEMLVVAVGAGLKGRGHDVRVVTFYDNNPLGSQLTERGVPVECLGKRGRWDIARFGCSFLSAVRRFQPDILYTVLPDSNLVALTARLAKPSSEANMGRFGSLSRPAPLRFRHSNIVLAGGSLGAPRRSRYFEFQRRIKSCDQSGIPIKSDAGRTKWRRFGSLSSRSPRATSPES